MCKRDDVCVWWVGGMLAVAKIVKLEQEKKDCCKSTLE